MNRDFGPLHDRVDLTATEARAIERMERVLTIDAAPRLRRELRTDLTLRTRVLGAWLSFRPWAVWMLPIATLGIVLTLSSSVLLAGLCAAAWAIGLGALLTESHARFNAKRRTRQTEHDEQDS